MISVTSVAAVADDESSRFRDNLDIRGEQSLAFGINEVGQLFKFGDLRVIGHGKSSADVHDLQVVSLFPGIIEYCRT